MGYLPEAIRNYLLRLGWSHGDDEIISTQQAIEWFNLESLGKSPSRFDFTKLDNVNGHYIREADNERLVGLILPILEEKTGKPVNPVALGWLKQGMTGLKQRAKNLKELAESSLFYVSGIPKEFTPNAQKALDADAKVLLKKMVAELEKVGNWKHDNLELVLRQFGEREQVGLGKVMMPLRAAITGSHLSPSMFEVMEVLGKEESLRRLGAVL
jgi:glutamyl-tRNA synthetase